MRKTIAFLLVAFLLAVTSCATNALIRPSWVDAVPRVPGMVVFVGSAQAGSESEARGLAYRDALSKLGSEMGYSLSDLYYRELTSTKSIADYGTDVTDEFKYSANGIWFYYVMIQTPEEDFYKARSPEYIVRVNRENRIESLLADSVFAYRTNRDLAAAEHVLEAVLVSLEGPVENPDYTPEALVEKAAAYLSRIKVESRKNSRKASRDDLTFRLVRDKGFFKPPVEDAIVKCTFSVLNLNGNLDLCTQLARTDSKGTFVFNRTNPYAVRDGEIEVRLGVDDDLLYRISLKGGEELLEPVYEAIGGRVHTRSYSYSDALDANKVLVALAEYAYDGSLRDETRFRTITEEFFQTLSVELPEVVTADGQEEEEAVEYLLENYPDYSTIYFCRIGVTDRTLVGDRWYSRTEGQILVIDVKAGTWEVQGLMQFATGGATTEEADTNALEGQAQITLGRLLSGF